jgi:NADP-reducing hydrogenase subunit HndB
VKAMVNLETLKQIQRDTLNQINLINTEETHRILIGMGTCGKAAGAKLIFDYLTEMKREYHYPIQICPTGCVGMCILEPMVEVIDRNGQHTVYINVDEQIMKEILHQHIKQNIVLDQYTINGVKETYES